MRLTLPLVLAGSLTLAGCRAPDAPVDAGTDAANDDDASALDVGVDAVALDAPSADTPVIDAYEPDIGPMPVRITVERVTDQHRVVPGAMFGGWGPHLGHLVRAAGDLYWVDDVCDPSVENDCDVNVNRRVGVFRRDPTGWVQIATIPLTNVQQNTATIATETALHTYGVDVVAGRVTECITDLATTTGTCTPIAIPTGASANYVGAAVSPAGDRLAWWTNVVDGGGGTFSYVVDYGGGWNGPRTGSIGGYNDFAYAHAGFVEGTSAVTFFGQVVSGLAPDWRFATLVGEADLTTAEAATFTNALVPPIDDTIASTNDLFVDRFTRDVHLLARAQSGEVVYYHRPATGPSAGTWSAPTILPPTSFRARFLESEAWIAIVSGPATGGMYVRRFLRSDVIAGEPLDFTRAIPEALPIAFGTFVGIYPEADVTQDAPVGGLHFCAVGDLGENVVTFFQLE